MNEEDGLECTICLSTYQIGETVAWSKLKNGCTHVFHYDCILKWALDGHVHCPICRTLFWSRDHSSVIQRNRVEDEGRCHSLCNVVTKLFTEFQQCIGSQRIGVIGVSGSVESNGSCNVIVELQTETAYSQSNLAPQEETHEESMSKDTRCIDVELCQFCVLHGLVHPKN